MSLKRFQLIPATLLFIFSACSPKKIEGELPPSPLAASEEFKKEILPLEPPLPTLTEPLFWDTSKVDISKIDKSRKLIAFTFDDAPARYLENILAVFAAYNERNPDCPASATLFCNGGRFSAHTPTLLQTALAMGLELGNHTQTHANLTALSKEELAQEIDETDALLQAIDGQGRHLLRAPFGCVNEEVKKTAAVPIIDWTIDTLDWTGVPADEIYDEVFSKRFSGAIVLMHDGYGHTVSALKRLLPDLKAEGYQVVNVSQLIKAQGCQFEKGKVYIRARKVKED